MGCPANVVLQYDWIPPNDVNRKPLRSLHVQDATPLPKRISLLERSSSSYAASHRVRRPRSLDLSDIENCALTREDLQRILARNEFKETWPDDGDRR